MWCLVVVLGAIGLTLNGCASDNVVPVTSPAPPPSATCPDGAQFPASPALLAANGSVSAKMMTPGANDVALSGNTSIWFSSGGNLRQDISLSNSARDLAIIHDQLRTCSNDATNITQYTLHWHYEPEHGACRTTELPLEPLQLQCANLTLFGIADGNATCKDVEDCPSGNDTCVVWSMPDPTSFHAQLFSKVKMTLLMAANAGSLAAASADMPESTINDVYFKNGTNEIVAMVQSQTIAGSTIEMTITFDTWNTVDPVVDSRFDIPSEWQSCVFQPPESIGAEPVVQPPTVTAMV